MKRSFFRNAWTTLFLALVGMAVGTTILLYGSQSTPASRQFVRSPEFLVWLFLILTQTALFALLPIPLWRAIKKIADTFITPWFAVAIFFLLFLALFCIPFNVPLLNWSGRLVLPLAYHGTKIRILAFLGLITSGMPAAIGISLVNAAVETDFRDPRPTKHFIVNYGLLQRNLQLFLNILGVMVGLLTLATGALRVALLAYGVEPAQFPSSHVLVYGAYFTMLIALIYIPTHRSLLAAGRRLRDACFPLPSPQSDDWADFLSSRRRIEEELQLQMGTMQRFQTNISILAPLLSGLASVLLS